MHLLIILFCQYLYTYYMYSQFKYQTYHIFFWMVGICPGVFGTGVIVQRVYVRGYMSGGICPGGICPGGICPRTVLLHITVIWSSKLRTWSNMTPKSLTFDDCIIILSPTLTDKLLFNSTFLLWRHYTVHTCFV